MTGVSVIIPTHYRNESLSRAIKSAIEQSHSPKEVIVVDDSGERFAEPVLSRLENNDIVQYHPLDENKGSQQAREKGVELATGEYLQFLDDDDRLISTKFDRQLEILTTSDHGVVYGGIRLPSGECILPQPTVRGEILHHALSFDTWPCCLGTMLINADLYDEIRPVKNKGEDFRIRIECAQRTTFDYINDPVMIVGTDTEYSLGDDIWQIEGQESILEEYSELYEQFPKARSAARGQIVTNRARNTRKNAYEEHLWSWQAVRDSFRAALATPENRLKETAIALATLGGRPTLKLGERFFSE
jgi:glycosyltransferase involved in cell wall biosynthesis